MEARGKKTDEPNKEELKDSKAGLVKRYFTENKIVWVISATWGKVEKSDPEYGSL